MGSNDFTDREKELQALAWQCFDGEPKVNYPKLAALAGMSNPASASNAWAKIKKKLVAQAAEAGGGTNGAVSEGSKSPEKAKATPSKRKRAAAKGKGEDGEQGGDDEESPTKKTKATPKKGGGRKKKAEAAAEAEKNGEEVKVKGEGENEEFTFD